MQYHDILPPISPLALPYIFYPLKEIATEIVESQPQVQEYEFQINAVNFAKLLIQNTCIIDTMDTDNLLTISLVPSIHTTASPYSLVYDRNTGNLQQPDYDDDYDEIMYCANALLRENLLPVVRDVVIHVGTVALGGPYESIENTPDGHGLVDVADRLLHSSLGLVTMKQQYENHVGPHYLEISSNIIQQGNEHESYMPDLPRLKIKHSDERSEVETTYIMHSNNVQVIEQQGVNHEFAVCLDTITSIHMANGLKPGIHSVYSTLANALTLHTQPTPHNN